METPIAEIGRYLGVGTPVIAMVILKKEETA
jgi:hypothetical protein